MRRLRAGEVKPDLELQQEVLPVRIRDESKQMLNNRKYFDQLFDYQTNWMQMYSD